VSNDSRASIASLTLLCGIFWSFSVNSGHTDDGLAIAEYSALEPPRFEISFRRGQLHLDGHTVSADHERQLLHAADRSFSAPLTSTRFKPLGVAPDKWDASSVSLLEALSATKSSHAVLSKGTLSIHGIGTDRWRKQWQILRAALRESIDLEVDMLIPDADVSVADICARAFAAHKSGPVYFEESGTELRSSAYPVLDRIISLANACRNSAVSITGHTDSSGNEASNQRLSLARAKAVADYIVTRGIARERVIFAGAGSSLPVADNATRYGRSLNRRISILLGHNDPRKTPELA